MYVARCLSAKFLEYLRFFPAIAVTGARQVGKSTWIQEMLGPSAKKVVFDPLIDVENARQDPELFLRSKKVKSGPLILDEIQYSPQVIPVLKRLIDEDRSPGQYILTGSQQWEVMKMLSESLAGRIVFIDLEGFNFSELAHRPAGSSWLEDWLKSPTHFIQQKRERIQLPGSLYDVIWKGFFPEVTFLPSHLVPTYFTAYMRTYIERDVRLLAEVNDWELFGRFVRLCAALSAQEINYSQLGRDLGLTPQSARRWLQILKATFQWFEVPAFSQNIGKRVSEKPKGFFADTGFLCFAQGISSPEALSGHPLWGAIFETAVASEIRKQIALMPLAPQIYHWRSHGGAEVDMILERDGKYYPIEIKAKSHPSKRDISGIHALRLAHPHLKIESGMVISPTQNITKLGEKDFAIPWDMN